MNNATLSHGASAALPLSQRIAVAAGSLLLGCALIWFAGFSHLEIVHNAAHDARHSAAFPCH